MRNNVTLAPPTPQPSSAAVTGDLESGTGRSRSPGGPVDVPVALVSLACIWWLVAAPRMWGGRGAGAVTVGAIVTGLATLAIRPHRYLPARVIWLALAVSSAAIGVAIVSPTGWAGASNAATYVVVSWTVVTVAAAVVRDMRLTEPLLLLVSIGVLVEVAEAWLPWWGGSNPSQPIIGTFYWHDPFAAFMLAGAILGLAFWLFRTRLLAAVGLFSFALGSVGVVYSTSRAALACLAAAIAIVVVAHLLVKRGSGVGRTITALAVGAGSVWVIGGPPFFPHRASPLAGTTARAAGQSLSQNGGYRVDFWHEAINVFRRHPVTGGGYHSLATASAGHVPAGWPLSPLAHDGYLQVLADGGLLLGVPFLLAIAGVCWWVVTAFVGAVRAREASLVGFALPLSIGTLLLHSAVDFDWSYPANFTVIAILVGVLGGRRVATGRPQRAGRSSHLLVGAVVLGTALTGVAAAAAWSGDLVLSLPMSHSAGDGATTR